VPVLFGPEEAPVELPELAAEPPDELPLEAPPAELPEEAPPAPAPAPPPCAYAKAEPRASTDVSASVATFILFPCGWLAKKQQRGFVDRSGTQREAIDVFQRVGGARSGVRPQRYLVKRINVIWAVHSHLKK
jgi:hypothetical protein